MRIWLFAFRDYDTNWTYPHLTRNGAILRGVKQMYKWIKDVGVEDELEDEKEFFEGVKVLIDKEHPDSKTVLEYYENLKEIGWENEWFWVELEDKTLHP